MDEWLTRKEATTYLIRIGCPVSGTTLANLAVRNNSGDGPPFTRIGERTIRYKKSDLDAWAAQKAARIG